jgi:hypothetical protein
MQIVLKSAGSASTFDTEVIVLGRSYTQKRVSIEDHHNLASALVFFKRKVCQGLEGERRDSCELLVADGMACAD